MFWIFDLEINTISRNMEQTGKKKNKKVFLIAQEIELAKLLAGNSKTVREKALRNLKKWFDSRSQAVRKLVLNYKKLFWLSILYYLILFLPAFTDDDFQRIWKGLFYTMWMSDKPLTQVCIFVVLSSIMSDCCIL